MSNEDRELLEAAAKAAGIKLLPDQNDGRLRDVTNAHPLQNLLAMPVWNPLTDDGDALRLAVKLRMNLVITTHGSSARCESAPSKWADENCAAGDDYGAATRRAIVRAAAATGSST